MLIPEFLKQGDLIGVPAPSDGSNCFEKEKPLPTFKSIDQSKKA